MRAAIVGCGHIAHRHLHAIRALRTVEIVAVCDRDLERAREVARLHRVAVAFDRFDDLLERSRPDIVHVLTPPASHRALVVGALEAGCHVIVEKPMALDGAEARDMIEAAARHGRQLAVCHSYAFVPSFRKARNLIERGVLGSITSADIFWRMSTYRPDLRGEAMQWMNELPGGPFMEVLPHLVYLLQALMPRLTLVDAVYAAADATSGPSELGVLFSSDAGPATLGLSLASSPVLKQLVVRGTKMTLVIDLATSTLVSHRKRPDTTLNRALTNVDHAWQLVAGLAANAAAATIGRLRHGHEALIASTYEGIGRNGRVPTDASGPSGLATMQMLDDLRTRLPRAGERPH